MPESSRTRGARWATVLPNRGLLPSPIAPHRVLKSAIFATFATSSFVEIVLVGLGPRQIPE